MTLSEHDQRVLRDLESSWNADSLQGRRRKRHGHESGGWHVTYLAGVTGVLIALAVTAIAVAMPAPLNIGVGVIGYLAAVGLSAKLAELHRHRRRGDTDN